MANFSCLMPDSRSVSGQHWFKLNHYGSLRKRQDCFDVISTTDISSLGPIKAKQNTTFIKSSIIWLYNNAEAS
jgi:hypothetical protein